MFAHVGHPQDEGLPASCRALERDIRGLASALGAAIRAERVRRHLTLRALAAISGVSHSAIGGIESGRVASVETYLRLGRALGLKPRFELFDPRTSRGGRQKDLVHAAMGELESERFRRFGLEVRLDEPYQHYQFAGRADLVAWSSPARSLLHVENRTAFPDLQDAFGAFNAKRVYLGAELAERAGVSGWRSQTHLMAALWSTEMVSTIRRHRSSFGTIATGSPGAFEDWWSGRLAGPGSHAAVILLDPVSRRSTARAWITLEDSVGVRARHTGYAEAARAIERAGH